MGVGAEGSCLKRLTAPHQQEPCVLGRPRLLLKALAARSRWTWRGASEMLEQRIEERFSNAESHRTRQRVCETPGQNNTCSLMSSSASVADKPDQSFARFEEGSAVTTTERSRPQAAATRRSSASLLMWVAVSIATHATQLASQAGSAEIALS